uniref:Uncharacterized protein n=1 Tax=Plectus sambesii TaxID=2011161 RepID=A0A914WBN6_9BILA
MVSLLCAAADLGRQLAHLIRRRSRSSRSRRAVDDDSEELPIDNVNTTSAGARSTIPRRHRLKRPQLPLPSRLHPSNSASPSVLSPPPMATSVGSRNTAGGRPSPPAASKPTTSLVKDSRTNKDVMPAINSKSSISGKTALQKAIITRNGIDQQKQTAVDSKNNIKAESEDKLAPASSPAVSEEHCHQIGRFSIIDERQKDPGSLESDFDDLDDSISSQTPASPAATGSRDSSRSSTEPPASSSAYPSLDTVPNDPVIASPCFPGRHLAMTTAASHHHLTTASSRFKIVPVDSTFKRGRWTCWDYYDAVDTSNGGSKGSLLKVASHPNKLSLHHRCDMIEYDKGRISQSCSRHGSGNHADKSELLHHALTNAAFAHHDAKPATPAAQKDHHVVKFALGASEPSTPEEHC